MRVFEDVHGVYFDDLDAFGILHNARYLLLFERSIGSFWREIGYDRKEAIGQKRENIGFVRKNEVEYLRPVVGMTQVRVQVWVEKLGKTSLTFGLRMLPIGDDALYAHGSRVVVKVNPETHRPVPWSDNCRERLAPYLAK